MKVEVKICPYCGQPMNARNDAEEYFQKTWEGKNEK